MPAPKFVAVKPTTLSTPILEADTEFTLKGLTDVYGNALSASSDFGSKLWLVFSPGGSNEEIVEATGFTNNANGSVTVNTGVVRAMSAKTPYGTGGVAYPHSAGEIVVVSNVVQYYAALVAYIESIAVAGAPDASVTAKGLSEEATTAEIEAGTEFGSTLAPLFVNPAKLIASFFFTRLPSSSQKDFLGGTTGMINGYGGTTAPTGFLLCDGTSYDADTYPSLVSVLLGRFGYGTGQTFTANAGTDFITANSHGLSNGDIVLLTTTSALPGGTTANTVYYVINKTTNTFQISTSVGGAAVNITDAGTGTHTFYNNFKVPDLRGSTMLGAGTKTVAYALDSASAVSAATAVPGTGTSSAAGNQVTFSTSHGLATGDTIVFLGTGPGGVTLGKTYFVSAVSGTVISLYNSYLDAMTNALGNAGITPVDLTDNQAGCTAWTKNSTFTIPSTMPSSQVYTGMAVTIATSSALPTNLSVGTYYAIRTGATTFQLADTLQHALDNIPTLFTSVGTGIQTVTVTLTARTVGDVGGQEKHNITLNDLPTGTDFDSSSYSDLAGSSSRVAVSHVYAQSQTGPIDIIDPFTVASYIIKT